MGTLGGGQRHPCMVALPGWGRAGVPAPALQRGSDSAVSTVASWSQSDKADLLLFRLALAQIIFKT
jgi:hypothetical protein